MTAVATASLPTVLRLREIQQATGVPTWTLRRWIHRGLLAAIQPGGVGVIFVRLSDVEAILVATREHSEGK